MCVAKQAYEECTGHQDDNAIVADGLCVDRVGPVLDLAQFEALRYVSMCPNLCSGTPTSSFAMMAWVPSTPSASNVSIE